MEKSGKCYYVIIKNKKRWKFSGAGPIQVAKKVASKKLKAGKEIEFYLDKVAGKKKRYGPYQARKDKKTGKISVIKARKVMKGGLLSHSDRQEIREIFYRFNDNLLFIPKNKNDKPSYIKTFKLPFVSFFNEPIIFFDPSIPSEYIKKYHYKYALFKEPNGNIYVIIYDYNAVLNIVSFAEFFLNPHYLSIKNREIIINELKKNLKENEAKTIKQNLLLIELVVINKKYTAIYYPNYSRLLIRKCVYPDLTFGILDKETVNPRINQEMIMLEVPESFYQLYLIKQQSFFNGYYEPVIYIQLPSQNKEELLGQSKNKPYFNYCIYTDPTDRNRLKVIIYNRNAQYAQLSISDFNEKLFNNININNINIKMACSILLTIPVEFGRLQRVRRIANNIINPQQYVGFQKNYLRQQLLYQRTNI